MPCILFILKKKKKSNEPQEILLTAHLLNLSMDYLKGSFLGGLHFDIKFATFSMI